MQHNTTAPVETMPGVFQDLPFYTAGLRDLPAVFFYLLISVVMHAIIQEYLLDKVNKKLHLSKVKYNKFNESGQLLAFYLVSLFWGGDLHLGGLSPQQHDLPLQVLLHHPDLLLAPHLPQALLPEDQEGGDGREDPVRGPLPGLHRGCLRLPLHPPGSGPPCDPLSLRGRVPPLPHPRLLREDQRLQQAVQAG